MEHWYKRPSASIGLRAAGLACLAISAAAAVRLHQLSQTLSVREATSGMLLLSAIVFLAASAGSALLFVGPGLWETVEVSERWRSAAPDGEWRSPE